MTTTTNRDNRLTNIIIPKEQPRFFGDYHLLTDLLAASLHYDLQRLTQLAQGPVYTLLPLLLVAHVVF